LTKAPPFAGNLTSTQIFQTWRESAWRNAERLLNARNPAATRQVENSIETNAAITARTIAATPIPPGYRPVPDRYCTAHNNGPLTP
jgi:hypothetical protein